MQSHSSQLNSFDQHSLNEALKKLCIIVDTQITKMNGVWVGTELAKRKATILTHLKQFLLNLPIVPDKYLKPENSKLVGLINHWLNEIIIESGQALIPRDVLNDKRIFNGKVSGVMGVINAWLDQNNEISIILAPAIQIERPKFIESYVILKKPGALQSQHSQQNMDNMHPAKMTEFDYFLAAKSYKYNETSDSMFTVHFKILILILKKYLGYQELGNMRLASKKTYLAIDKNPVLQEKYYTQHRFMFFVKSTDSGSIRTIQAYPKNFTEDLTEAYARKINVHPGELRFSFAGKQLDNGRTLSDYNVQENCIVHQTLKLQT
jgi:hypothetical protein